MMCKNQRGITLIALIITVIIILILAIVGISLLNSDNGIIKNAQLSGEKYNESAKNENEIITGLLNISNDNGTSIPNNIKAFSPIVLETFPDGFKIKGETTSTDGKIIAYVAVVDKVAMAMANTVETNEMNINNLKSGTEYEMFIVAIDELGNSRKSEVIKVKTKMEVIVTQEFLKTGSTYGTVSITTNNMDGKDGLSITGRPNVAPGGSGISTTYRWYKDIDLTNYSKLTFYARKTVNHGSIYVYIDGVSKLNAWYGVLQTAWTKYEIDISDIKGIKTVVLAGGYSDNSGSTSSNSQYCDIRLIE